MKCNTSCGGLFNNCVSVSVWNNGWKPHVSLNNLRADIYISVLNSPKGCQIFSPGFWMGLLQIRQFKYFTDLLYLLNYTDSKTESSTSYNRMAVINAHKPMYKEEAVAYFQVLYLDLPDGMRIITKIPHQESRCTGVDTRTKRLLNESQCSYCLKEHVRC
jgi:hypothetical protein